MLSDNFILDKNKNKQKKTKIENLKNIVRKVLSAVEKNEYVSTTSYPIVGFLPLFFTIEAFGWDPRSFVHQTEHILHFAQRNLFELNLYRVVSNLRLDCWPSVLGGVFPNCWLVACKPALPRWLSIGCALWPEKDGGCRVKRGWSFWSKARLHKSRSSRAQPEAL